eukprot:SAG31_NODE_219_length_19926_cov_4.297297_3_plen_84_part_00
MLLIYFVLFLGHVAHKIRECSFCYEIQTKSCEFAQVRVVLVAALTVQLCAIGFFATALSQQLPAFAVVAVFLQAAALGGAYSV